jgi:hypothetical protein
VGRVQWTWVAQVIGLAGVAIPVTVSAYENKAQAENVIKIGQAPEIEALRAEIDELRAGLPQKKPPRKRTNDDLAGQMRILLEHYQSE